MEHCPGRSCAASITWDSDLGLVRMALRGEWPGHTCTDRCTQALGRAGAVPLRAQPDVRRRAAGHRRLGGVFLVIGVANLRLGSRDAGPCIRRAPRGAAAGAAIWPGIRELS